MELRIEADVLGYGQVLVEAGGLRHVADEAFGRLGIEDHVLTQHLDLAGGRRHQAAQDAKTCGLAGAVRARPGRRSRLLPR